MNSVIRYLKQWEKQGTRDLYETAFPGDSKEFVDYYYQWKTRDNEIIVMEGERSMRDNFLHVMIHLNPYIIWMNGRRAKIPYLVAVAADPGCRRQGNMRQVMCRLLQDLEQKKTPFTFLLPADPAYYKGQGFVFFPNMNLTGIQKEAKKATIQAASASVPYDSEELADILDDKNNLCAAPQEKDIAQVICYGQEIPQSGKKWRKAAVKDIPEMIRYSNGILQERHDLVINRDKYYYQRLLAETEAEHGGVLLLGRQGNLHGMLTYAVNLNEMQLQGRFEAEVKELLLEESVTEEEGRKICKRALQETAAAGKSVPKVICNFEKMMVRITSLTETVPLLRSRRRRSLRVKVTDSIIEANNGCFQIILDWDGSRIERISEDKTAPEMDISILAQELWRDVSVYLNEWV